MIKIWNEAFLKKAPSATESDNSFKKPVPGALIPSIILGATSLFMGLFAATIFSYTMLAAEQLLEPANYIKSVLNEINM
jgi:multicomponent Na+:H+ antiporter subunit D